MRPQEGPPRGLKRTVLTDPTGDEILKFAGHWGEYFEEFCLISELANAFIPPNKSKKQVSKGLNCFQIT